MHKKVKILVRNFNCKCALKCDSLVRNFFRMQSKHKNLVRNFRYKSCAQESKKIDGKFQTHIAPATTFPAQKFSTSALRFANNLWSCSLQTFATKKMPCAWGEAQGEQPLEAEGPKKV